MARQDLQNRNLKTHGTPRDKTNFTTIACPGRPSIGQQRDFSTCLWPATTGSAHGLPLGSQAACGPAASVCSAQPRPGGLWGLGAEPRRPRISSGPEDQPASDRAVPTLEITSRRPPNPLLASHAEPAFRAAADEELHPGYLLISPDPHGARPLSKEAGDCGTPGKLQDAAAFLIDGNGGMRSWLFALLFVMAFLGPAIS